MGKPITPKEFVSHWQDWTAIVKSSYGHSSTRIAKTIGVSLGTFNRFLYGDNYEGGADERKYLAIFAIAYRDELEDAANKIGIKLPPVAEVPKEDDKEIVALKQQISDLRALLDSYKDSNNAMQQSLGNKEAIIMKLTETVDRLAEKVK